MRRAVAAVLASSALVLGGCHAATGTPAATSDPSGSATLDGVDRQLDTIEQGLDVDGRG